MSGSGLAVSGVSLGLLVTLAAGHSVESVGRRDVRSGRASWRRRLVGCAHLLHGSAGVVGGPPAWSERDGEPLGGLVPAGRAGSGTGAGEQSRGPAILKAHPSSTTARCRATPPSSMPIRSSHSRVLRWPDRDRGLGALATWAATARREHPGVRAIGYFGSYARGDWGRAATWTSWSSATRPIPTPSFAPPASTPR